MRTTTGIRLAAGVSLAVALLVTPAVTPAAPLLLNEYNAVRSTRFLNGGDALADDNGGQASDPFFGRVAGNGGNWFELVVVADELDIRGWQITIDDDDGDSVATLTFSLDALWADLRAGTLITVAEDVPDDVSYDPDAGDWWIHVRAGKGGSGQYISATGFKTSNDNTQFEIRMPDGTTVFGPAGEAISPPEGVGSREVFALQTDPSALVGERSDFYNPSVASTFGAPNLFGDPQQRQDFSALRGGNPTADQDEDGAANCGDNCPEQRNVDQSDADGDGYGDACDPDQGGEPGSTPPGTGCVPDLFDDSKLLDIELRMTQENWDALRLQPRPVLEAFDCSGGGLSSDRPFDFFPADVVVDGHVVSNAGVRKKGFLGSMDSSRPSLKVKFSEYEPGQRLFGVERMTLNNGKQDPARITQCIAYHLMADAGVPAPRCNLAHVRVTTENGTQDLGIYAHIDSIKPLFLEYRFSNSSGNLYEGMGADFRPTRQEGFNIKNNEAINDGTELDPITRILATVPDSELFDALAPYINLDAFLTYWVMEGLTGHWDSYSGGTNNNFFIYRNRADDLFYFIPWGMDDVLGQGSLLFGEGPVAPLLWARSRLTRRIYLSPGGANLYAERMQTLLDTIWDETALLAEIDRLAALIKPVTGELGAPLDEVRSFVSDRRAKFEAEFGSGPPAWEEDLPRGFPCLEEAGNISVDFSTIWQEIVPQFPSDASEVALAGSLFGLDLATEVPFRFFVAGGPDFPQFSTGGVLRLVFTLGDLGMHVVQINVVPGDVAPGRIVDLAGDITNAFVSVDESQQPYFLGVIADGFVQYDSENASAVPGEVLAGHLEATLAQFVPSPGSCQGDCNADRSVTVDDLVVGVNVALGNRDSGDCLAVDANEDYSVTVDELVGAVNSAIDGCPQTATFIDIPPLN